jgi:hypothetical protein
MSDGEWIPARPHCLPGCGRLDGHDGRDPGACMKDGAELLSTANCLHGEFTHIPGECDCTCPDCGTEPVTAAP